MSTSLWTASVKSWGLSPKVSCAAEESITNGAKGSDSSGTPLSKVKSYEASLPQNGISHGQNHLDLDIAISAP